MLNYCFHKGILSLWLLPCTFTEHIFVYWPFVAIFVWLCRRKVILNSSVILSYTTPILLKLSPQTNDTLKKLHLLLGRWWRYTSNTSNARLFHNVSRNCLQNWFVRLGRCKSRSRKCNGTKLIWSRSVTLKSDTRNIHKKIESLERKIPINKLVYCSINAELCEKFVFLCIAIAALVWKMEIDQVLVISWTK